MATTATWAEGPEPARSPLNPFAGPAAADQTDPDTDADALRPAGTAVRWDVASDAGHRFTVALTVVNPNASTGDPWSVSFPFRHRIEDVAGATSVQDGAQMTLSGTTPVSGVDVRLTARSVAPLSRVPATCAVAEGSCRVVIVERDSDDSASPPASSPSSNSPSQTATPPSTPSQTATPPDSPSQRATSPTAIPPTAGAGPTPGEPGAGAGPDQTAEPPARPQGPGVEVALNVMSDWGTGQSVIVSVRNSGDEPLSEWVVSVPWGVSVDSMWNATSASGPGVVRASSATWNGMLGPGEATEFGVNVTPGSGTAPDGTCSASTTGGSLPCTIAEQQTLR